MKILCVVSEFRGHLDFGGGGYLRLADALRARGHVVGWMTRGFNVEALRGRGQAVSRRPAPIAPAVPAAVQRGSETLAALATGAALVRDEVREERPDVCLLDRNQSVAAMVMATHDVPFVAIGTPGGHWGYATEGVVPLTGPCPVFGALGERLRREAPWLGGALDSWWVCSPHLNVTFMGRSLYADVRRNAPAAFVDLFGPPKPADRRRRIGVTFGHSGKPKRLLEALRRLRAGGWLRDEPIDVFVGDRADLAAALAPQGAGVRVRGWTAFDEAFLELRALIGFGGTGTLWHCVDHLIPLLAVPGGFGDQRFNAGRLAPLGIGSAWSAPKGTGVRRQVSRVLPWLEPGDDAALREAARRLLDTDHGPALRRFRARENFTHDLESLVAEIEVIGRDHAGRGRGAASR